MILVENLPVPLDRRVWQEAIALRDDGWAVAVIGPRGTAAMARLHERLDGIEVMRYPQRAASGLAGYLVEYVPSMLFTFAWLFWARLRSPIHVIHGCNPPDLFWVFGWIGRLWGAAYVFDQHDANPELSETKFGREGPRAWLLRALTTFLERQNYRAATLVLAANGSYAAIARGRGGVPDDRIVVIRNAPDVAAFRALSAGVVADLRRVGYVGVMGSQEGLDVLLDAWAVVQAMPDLEGAHLELVGDGEARAQLQEQAARLGIADVVTFHGYLSAERFVPLLAACAVCVSPDLPTPFNDVSTMVKVTDYLAIGRPVITFDLGETRYLIGGGGWIVNEPTPAALAEALAAAMRDPAGVAERSVAAAGRPAVLQLDWQRSAQRLREAYADLVPADRR